MTEQQLLTRAVCVDPADDLPRLVLADWLEENGEGERAEFIRVQCEYDRYGDITTNQLIERRELDRFVHLQRRVQRLLYAHGEKWFCRGGIKHVVGMPLDGYFRGQHYATARRGFPTDIRCTLAEWQRHGPALVAAFPLESVRLTDREPLTMPWRGDRWSWWSDRIGGEPEPDEIPDETLREMAGIHSVPSMYFGSPEDAHAALSLACLNVERRNLGLPLLTAPAPTAPTTEAVPV